MRRKSFAAWPCSIARTADVFGDAWTLLVLRELFYGEKRFDGFVQALGIPRNTLASRLALLVEEDMLERRSYQAEPVRHEYVLTEKGRDFFGVLAAINAWGDRWLSGAAGAPIIMRHEVCGNTLSATVTCAECAEQVLVEDVTVHAGPGYPAQLAGRRGVIERFGRP